MPSPYTFTIANGETVSDAFDLAGQSITKMEFPTMTSTALTITELAADGNYKTVGNETGNLSITSPSTRLVHLGPIWSLDMGRIKLVAGSAERDDRVIKVYTRSYTP